MSVFQTSKLYPLKVIGDNANKENRLANVGNKFEATHLSTSSSAQKTLDYETLIRGLMFLNQKVSAEVTSMKSLSKQFDFSAQKDYFEKFETGFIPYECILEAQTEIDDLWAAFNEEIKAGKQILRQKEKTTKQLKEEIELIDQQNRHLEIRLKELNEFWTQKSFASSCTERDQNQKEIDAQLSKLLATLKEKRTRLEDYFHEVSLRRNTVAIRSGYEESWYKLNEDCRNRLFEEHEITLSTIQSLHVERKGVQRRYETEQTQNSTLTEEKARLRSLLESHDKEKIIEKSRMQYFKCSPIDLHSKSLADIENAIQKVNQRREEKKQSLADCKTQANLIIFEKLSKEALLQRTNGNLVLLKQSNQDLELQLSHLNIQTEELSTSLDSTKARLASFNSSTLSTSSKEKELQDLQQRFARKLAQMTDLNNRELASEVARNESKLKTMESKAKILRELIGQLVLRNKEHFEFGTSQ